ASAILTGKVFEYLAANRPILAFCPEKSDVAQIINETNSGWTLRFEEKADLKTLIIELFNQYLNGDLSVNQKDTMKYSRKELTRKMAELFNKVVAEN
ncbi:MAG: glycosyl transferase family 1, partial [Ignavibacteria bacterium]|nr:glycosyl transferase family 1 [Ignavibacteria bacterium]